MNKLTSFDASVLINFLRIDRLDLFAKSSFSLIITDHVKEEVSSFFPDQQHRLQSGLENGVLKIENISSVEEFELFGQLSQLGQLGAGECAAISLAVKREYYLGIDDRRAIKKTSELLPSHRILRTQDFILTMIREQILEPSEADAFISQWSLQHRFKLPVESFALLS